MKKYLYSLSIIALVAFGTSCSSDDSSNGTEQTSPKSLELSADVSNVFVGDKVNFTITDGTKTVDAELYKDNKLVQNPVEFNEAGKFAIVAKSGLTVSNVMIIDVQNVSSIVGSWVPTNVYVGLPTSPLDMPYPHKEGCDQDVLTFDKSNTVVFNLHSETCEITPTGTSWQLDAGTKMLSFNLFGQDMKVEVKSSTDKELVIKAKGDQFAALIPILMPDIGNSLPTSLLSLIQIELSFEKK